MPDPELELLAVASSFSKFAGPNNPILDLLNVLSRNTGTPLALLTTSSSAEREFAELIRFPVYPELDGMSSAMAGRAAWALPNVLRAKRAIARLRPRRLIVFSNVDTAFEVASAVGGPIVAGYNVFFNVPHASWVDRLGLPLQRGRSWRDVLYRTADRVAAKTIVRGVLAHTAFHKRLYIDLEIPEDRIRVVPHCIDMDRISRMASSTTSEGRERPREEVTVLYAGRLDPEKGVGELLEAAEVASREVPTRLQIVGTGPLGAQVRGRPTQEPSSRLRIESYPAMGPARLLPMIRSADIVAIPSRVEAFGIVALEAMALGRAIVATRFGGIAEVIRDGSDGLLVDPRNHEEFGAALVTLARDEALRGRLGRSGRMRVQDAFEASVVAPKFLRAVEEFN